MHTHAHTHKHNTHTHTHTHVHGPNTPDTSQLVDLHITLQYLDLKRGEMCIFIVF